MGPNRSLIVFVFVVAGSSMDLSIAWADDLDADGIEDSLDVCCETPGGIPVDSTGRPIGDLDGDCDVDLADYSQLQLSLFGAAAQGCCFDNACDDGDPCTLDACDTAGGECLSEVVGHCGECVLDASCPVELECDVPVVGSISSAAETDTMCFCVTESELVRISVIEQPGSGAGFNPNWRILDAAGNPAPVCGAFTTAVFDDCGPLPAAGSPYQLVIEDGARNDIGSYKATLQRLRIGTGCDDTPIQCDVPAPGSITDTAEEDLFRFDVKDGEIVRISVVEANNAPSNFGPSWRLIDGQGRPERSCGAFASSVDRDCGPLFPSGNPYRVEVEDGGRNEVGTYSVYLQRLGSARSCEGQGLECGTTMQGIIDSNGDSDLFNFRVVEGEIVRFSLAESANQPANFNSSWRLMDGNGFPAVACGTFSTTIGGVDCGPLPAAGNPYRLEIQDGTRNDTGVYLVRLDRLASHRACDQAGISCGIGQPGSIANLVDLNLHSFEVPEAEVVRVAIFEQAGSGASFAPTWRLLDGAGLPAPVCGAFSTATSVDCGPLPAFRNPYRLEVEDQGRNDVGSYTATITFLTTGCP